MDKQKYRHTDRQTNNKTSQQQRHKQTNSPEGFQRPVPLLQRAATGCGEAIRKGFLGISVLFFFGGPPFLQVVFVMRELSSGT